MTAWVVAGPAGSGKTTLGRALARHLRVPLVDLDSVTNPLLDGLGDLVAPDGHWNEEGRRARVRPARYAALRAVAADQVAAGLDVVLVAPFTAELRGGPEWTLLTEALAPAPVRVLWLRADDALLRHRVAGRRETRDAVRTPAELGPPAVDHLVVDAASPTAAQLARLARPADQAEPGDGYASPP
jgi:sugar-phosphatase